MARKPRLRLVHADASAARERAATLRAAGYTVDASRLEGPEALRALGARPPDAVVIDLSRAPGFGRDLGLALRGRKATRALPLVFVGGAEEDLSRVRALLPDATFASWRGIRGALRRARGGRGAAELVLWFVTRRADLERRLEGVARRMAEGGGLWIAWPKRASGVTTDVTQDLVRGTGLAAGFVDYKICAIDATWSGLKFARRRR